MSFLLTLKLYNCPKTTLTHVLAPLTKITQCGTQNKDCQEMVSSERFQRGEEEEGKQCLHHLPNDVIIDYELDNI